MKIHTTSGYVLVQEFYGDQRAQRSQVKLMHHIDEGLMILDWLGASLTTQEAYCIHPILQSDQALSANWQNRFDQLAPQVIILCMEYRKTANAYLSTRAIHDLDEISLSVLPEVNQMLIADKVQNYKDFLIYHKGSHSRSEALDKYFQNWLTKLAISMEQFEIWRRKLS